MNRASSLPISAVVALEFQIGVGVDPESIYLTAGAIESLLFQVNVAGGE
jgi:hypothetical protein